MNPGSASLPRDEFFVPRPDIMETLRALLIERRERGILVQAEVRIDLPASRGPDQRARSAPQTPSKRSK